MPSAPLPPASNGLPLIGETVHLLVDRQFSSRRRERYGSIFRTHLLGKPTLIVSGASAAKMVLSTNMGYLSWGAGWPDTFKTLLGDSLFVQDGEEHQRNRKLLMPAFHGKALAGYFAQMDAIIQRYLARWLEKREFAWFVENKQLTFDIAAALLLGVKSGDDVAPLSQAFSTLTNGFFVISRSTQAWTTFGKALKARDHILEYIDRAIDQRRKQPANDALSMLIEARDEHGNGLSQHEITVQALLLLFAGHETSTSMITSMCLELARHPDVLARARAEQTALAQQGAISLEQLQQMPYLDQVLSETERLHPPVAGGFRGVVKSFEYEGYTIPAGWRLQYNILETHLDPSIYPNPTHFDPDRFSPERAEHKKQPFSLIGFGGGPRICLGMAFAKMEMKLLMAHLLRGYQWDLLPNQDLDLAIVPTRRPKDNLQVFFRRWHG